MSVSAPCEPVAPSTNTGYTVSLVELFAETVKLSAVPVVSWLRVPTVKSNVLSESSYATVIPLSVFELTIAPTVSAIVSAKVTPSTVIASASKVPSTSTFPDMSKVAAAS